MNQISQYNGIPISWNGGLPKEDEKIIYQHNFLPYGCGIRFVAYREDKHFKGDCCVAIWHIKMKTA
jgi:hypothetical protein